MLYMCQVSTNREVLMNIYMLWARDVLNILEYKPSLKTIKASTGGPAEKNVQLEEVLPTIKGLECGGLPCARKLKLAVSMPSGSED